MLNLVLFIKYTFQDFSTPQQKSEKTGQFPTRGNLLEYLYTIPHGMRDFKGLT